MRRSVLSASFAIAVAALVVLIAVSPPTGTTGAHATGSPGTGGGIPTGAANRAPAPLDMRAAGPPISCLSVPRTAPCFPGVDTPVVDLISNASDSGGRFSVGVSLPPAGTNPASVLGSFWVGLWVTGAPCSVDDASYLSVNLYPPYSPAVVPASQDWVAQVPVHDLVPSGSCDPLCQNASATGAIDGIPTCEDNIVLGGGWADSSNLGRFAPGDQLLVTAWGTPGDTSPLTIWVNDTSNSSASVRWQYGSSATVTGVPVGPRFASSNASDGGWATPYDAAFGWTDCPSATDATGCNSYDQTSLGTAGVPLVTSATYWNASTASVESFPWIATASSSGGCGGDPTLSACPDSLAYGGTGAYPTLAIVPEGSSGSAWRIGGTSGAIADYGGESDQFLSNGSAVWESPASIRVTSASGETGVATVNVTVADPRGASVVEVGTVWCSPGGPSETEVEATVSGTLANATLELNLTREYGNLTYWVAERSVGTVWSPPVAHTLQMFNGTGPCTLPSPAAPTFGASNVTAVAGGYHLTWGEGSPNIRGYRLTVNATMSGFAESVDLGNVTSTTVTGLPTPGSYRITLLAETLENTSSSTTYSPSVAPLEALSAVASLPPGPFWHGSTPTGLNLTLSGGAEPFQVLVSLGNGTTVAEVTTNNSTTVPVVLDAALGFVEAGVTVEDANGVFAESSPLLRDVWAGPLAPVAAMSAGAGLVGVNWTPSISPAAPVVGYRVYLTANASAAATAYLAGSSNSSANITDGGVEIWNATNRSVVALWQDNSTAYATVVPENSLGTGFATAAPLEATPAPLSPGSIQGGPGGPDPYTASFSTVVTTGTNDPIDEAIYSFPGFAFVPANVTRTSPTEVFVNASARLTTLGLVEVLLHVSDSFGGTAIVSTDVYVSPGAAPLVSVEANPSPAYVGVAVNFTASATGTGPFSYSWQFGDGTNGSGATADHTYARAGTFTATVTVVDNGTGGSNTTSVTEDVYALPTVLIVTDAGANGSGSFAFHANLLGGSGAGSFVWAFGDGAVGRGENVTHTYTTAGTFVVNVTATDASLRTAYANVTVQVGAPPATSSGSSALGTFTPLAAGLLVAALVGWGVAVIAVLRLRNAPEKGSDARSADDVDE
jgi:PKD repeat protein